MSLTKKHVLGFSPNSELFALVDEQGILRIWDTETSELKQEFTPNLHLSGSCTALTWVTVATAELASEKKEKRFGKSKDALYIALGNSKGQISLYSYAEGKIERTLKGEGHSGRITSIVYDQLGTLYTAGSDCQVIAWSLREERRLTAWSVGQEKPQTIAYASLSKSIVVGAREIKVYSIEQQELLQTFTGHSSEINAICTFSVNNTVEYALTTSQMERLICVWKLGNKGRNKIPAGSLLMEDVAHCLACQLQNGDILRVVSVTRSGVVHIYFLPINTLTSEKPIKPKVTLEIASDSTSVIEPIPALAAHFEYDLKRPNELLFGYGSLRMLIFERYSPNYREKMNVLVRADPKKLYIAKKGKNGDTTAEEIAIKTVTPIIRFNEIEYQTSHPISKKRLQNEVPMESRLQNLNINDGPVAIQSQSKVQLLVQALHCKDADLLRSVLCTKDIKTIELTLQRLPVQYVGTLVNELTLLMEQKRANVDFALLWLRIITHTHSGQLLAMGNDLLNKFGACLGIIEYRANCLKEVSKLNGRVNLLINMIKRNTTDDNLNENNAIIVEDIDAAEQVDESVFSFQDSSDGNWSEDDDLDDEKSEKEADDDSDDFGDKYKMELDD